MNAAHSQTDKLKVLIVIDSLLPGGAERSLLSILPGLAERQIEPKLVCLKRVPVNLENRAVELGFPPHYLLDGEVGGKWYFKLPYWIRRLRQCVRDERPALVHSTLFQASLTSRLGLVGTRVPHLSSVVNMDYSPERNQDPNIKGGSYLSALKLGAVLALNRLTTGLVSRFHAVTPAIKAETTRHLGVPPEKISVVFRGRQRPMPIPEERRKEVRKSLGIAPETKVLLNVGRQEYQKGQLYLLRALAEEPLRDQDIKLLVAGRRGAVSAELEEEIQRLNLGEKVQILGHRDDIPELLGASDAFILPSLFEGAAGALLEAMSARVPMVVSALPELKGLVDERCALTVPTRSPESIAIATARLLHDQALSETLTEEGLRIFNDSFLLERIVAEMAMLYRETAKYQAP